MWYLRDADVDKLMKFDMVVGRLDETNIKDILHVTRDGFIV